MALMIVGLILFFGTHSIYIATPQLRTAGMARLGENGWKGVYSLLSLVGLVVLIWGYGLARENPVVIWYPPVFTRHIALTLMLIALPLLVASFLPAGWIKAKARHPMLASVKIWAFAHLLANGTLNDILLFGLFLAWAVAARISLKRRPMTVPKAETPRAVFDLIAVVAGVAIYLALLLGLHEWLIGVSPLG